MQLIKASKKAHDLFDSLAEDDVASDEFIERCVDGKIFDTDATQGTGTINIVEDVIRMIQQMPQGADIYYFDVFEQRTYIPALTETHLINILNEMKGTNDDRQTTT